MPREDIEISGSCNERPVMFRQLMVGRLFVFVDLDRFKILRGQVFIKLSQNRIQELSGDVNSRYTVTELSADVREVSVFATVPSLRPQRPAKNDSQL